MSNPEEEEDMDTTPEQGHQTPAMGPGQQLYPTLPPFSDEAQGTPMEGLHPSAPPLRPELSAPPGGLSPSSLPLPSSAPPALPSTPEGQMKASIEEVYIRVTYGEKPASGKLDVVQLQKALQSWFNKNEDDVLKGTTCQVKAFLGEHKAVVLISPASADMLGGTVVEELLKLGDIILSSKTHPWQASVRFLSFPDDPWTPNTDPPTSSQAKPSNRNEKVIKHSETKWEPAVYDFPKHLWRDEYRREIESIERERGVRLTSKLMVSFEKSPDTESCNLDDAKNDFENILQCLERQDNMAMFKTAQKADRGIPSEQSMAVWNSSAQKISLNIKDPLVSNGLCMDENLWNLIDLSFPGKKDTIQNKFGVTFKTEVNMKTVTVRAECHGNEAAAMQSHALRALLRLYQKVATSFMSCSIDGPKVDLRNMAASLPVIVTADKYSSWRLIGLPENLRQAIAELEKRGGFVFKAEDKQRIEKPADTMFSSGGVSMKSGAASMGGVATAGGAAEDETCPICMDEFKNIKKLKCGHKFCGGCLDRAMESQGKICPLCKDVFGKLVGNQPDGHMSCSMSPSSLPGFKGCGTITIDYTIPGGRQQENHPTPGTYYSGIRRTAYLPNNDEGREVLALLKRAWEQRLTFTIGTSRTTGLDGVVTWNDIHHKTNTHGGQQNYGYPDPHYLRRVKEELKAKGIE